ncbi:ADL051Wp [Eremothecium gossypii ATCC 10895]|uniref:ADL051Wp n=1 Tax=Eremothecium gossypii (strain ATCC 10895 / CBS 109.51 / FGSC 9923 / NRRL Y-1056) TaxID=284811 RepID=Q75AH8_EREGS|nr:ADL051Wp [Eremothecium gossypii ATCC 10895]AAS51869.1 ADL051Wp [Eremothecium gossypii ATCC 10895]AEY96167.1 FADL051Wp [Eremothecium gossypii FDAG1]
MPHTYQVPETLTIFTGPLHSFPWTVKFEAPVASQDEGLAVGSSLAPCARGGGNPDLAGKNKETDATLRGGALSLGGSQRLYEGQLVSLALQDVTLSCELSKGVSDPANSVHKVSGKTCAICRKSFTRKTSLQTHMLIHTKAKPYRCPYRTCNKTFNVKSNLYRHERIHKRNCS